MKIYLVWYRTDQDSSDQIRGAALNWERAERMALSLEMHMSSLGQKVEVGVRTHIHGELYIDPEGCDNRWTKEDFEVKDEIEIF